MFSFYLRAYHDASYEEAGEAYGCHGSNLQQKPNQLQRPIDEKQRIQRTKCLCSKFYGTKTKMHKHNEYLMKLLPSSFWLDWEPS